MLELPEVSSRRELDRLLSIMLSHSNDLRPREAKVLKYSCGVCAWDRLKPRGAGEFCVHCFYV